VVEELEVKIAKGSRHGNSLGPGEFTIKFKGPAGPSAGSLNIFVWEPHGGQD